MIRVIKRKEVEGHAMGQSEKKKRLKNRAPLASQKKQKPRRRGEENSPPVVGPREDAGGQRIAESRKGLSRI